MTEPSTPPPPTPEAPARKGTAGMSVSLALALVLVVLFAVFAVQNTEPVRLELLSWTFEVSLIVLLLAAGAVFVVLDQIAGYLWRRRRRRRRIAKALRKG